MEAELAAHWTVLFFLESYVMAVSWFSFFMLDKQRAGYKEIPGIDGLEYYHDLCILKKKKKREELRGGEWQK